MFGLIETKEKNNPVVLREIDFSDPYPEYLEVTETLPIRIMVTDAPEDLVAHVGDYELKRSCAGDFSYFCLSDYDDKNLRQQEFFTYIFMNNLGNSEFIFSSNSCGVKFSLPVKVLSVKVDEEEVDYWMNKICEVFPMYEAPNLSSPITSFKAKETKKRHLSSLTTFLREVDKKIDRISLFLQKTDYLKASSKKTSLDTYSQEVQVSSRMNSWFSEYKSWKRVPFDVNRRVRKGIYCFEPTSFKKIAATKNYNHTINASLRYELESIQHSLSDLKHILHSQSPAKIEVRSTQFAKIQSKRKLLETYLETLKSVETKVSTVVEMISEYGVKKVTHAAHYAFDARYPILSDDIFDLKGISQFFREISNEGNLKIGSIGIDYLFEYFCFAELVQTFESLNFKVVEQGAAFPVSFYVELFNSSNNIRVRLFHDQPVPKSDSIQNNHPLKDVWKTGAPKRPDFLLHFSNGMHDGVAIVDAKFMREQNCKDKFKKVNGENLIAKYGTKYFQNTGNKLPPFFVGALHVQDREANLSKYQSAIASDFSFGANSASFQQAGWLALSSKSRSTLEEFVKLLIDHFEAIGGNVLPIPSLKYGIPSYEEAAHSQNNTVNDIEDVTAPFFRNSAVRNTVHIAPTVTEGDAALIKGMLHRGDKPQDIALFFGVNNGRVSEIKSGTKFLNISPADTDNLPPAGPYPPLRFFLNGDAESFRSIP